MGKNIGLIISIGCMIITSMFFYLVFSYNLPAELLVSAILWFIASLIGIVVYQLGSIIEKLKGKEENGQIQNSDKS